MASSSTMVFLKDVDSGELREAELCDGIQECHLTDVEEIWQPALTLLQRWGDPRHRQESAHWDWRAKLRRSARNRQQRSFAIVFRDVTQGLMIVDVSRTARLEPDLGLGLVYVDYVEVAPWNRPGWIPHRLFQSVGTHFLSIAVDLSFQLGFAGRIGLHSLPQADGFYRRHQMTDLGPDPDYQNLCYFESTASAPHMSPMRDSP